MHVAGYELAKHCGYIIIFACGSADFDVPFEVTLFLRDYIVHSMWLCIHADRARNVELVTSTRRVKKSSNQQVTLAAVAI